MSWRRITSWNPEFLYSKTTSWRKPVVIQNRNPSPSMRKRTGNVTENADASGAKAETGRERETEAEIETGIGIGTAKARGAGAGVEAGKGGGDPEVVTVGSPEGNEAGKAREKSTTRTGSSKRNHQEGVVAKNSPLMRPTNFALSLVCPHSSSSSYRACPFITFVSCFSDKMKQKRTTKAVMKEIFSSCIIYRIID